MRDNWKTIIQRLLRVFEDNSVDFDFSMVLANKKWQVYATESVVLLNQSPEKIINSQISPNQFTANI